MCGRHAVPEAGNMEGRQSFASFNLVWHPHTAIELHGPSQGKLLPTAEEELAGLAFNLDEGMDVDGAGRLGGCDHPLPLDDGRGRVRPIERLQSHLEESQALGRDGTAGYYLAPKSLRSPAGWPSLTPAARPSGRPG